MPDVSLTDRATHSLLGLEIFSAGKWHGDTYSESDLDGMVEAFGHVGFKPPLKLGHSENQTLLQESGLPAAGWIQRVYRNGKKLLADITDIPNQVYQLMHKKAYDRVSVEIYMNYDDTVNSKKWPKVLKALAVLGADIPEVTNLEGISALYDDKGRAYRTILFEAHGTEAASDDKECTEKAKREEALRMEKEIKEKQDAADKDIETLKAESVKQSEQIKAFEAQAKTDRERAEKLEKELNAERESRRVEGIKTKVSEFVRAKKITPAQAPLIESLWSSIPSEREMVVTYSKDGKPEVQKFTASVLFEKFIDAQPQYFSDEQLVEGNRVGDEDQVDTEVKKYMKENNEKDYGKALREVGRMKKGGI